MEKRAEGREEEGKTIETVFERGEVGREEEVRGMDGAKEAGDDRAEVCRKERSKVGWRNPVALPLIAARFGSLVETED